MKRIGFYLLAILVVSTSTLPAVPIEAVIEASHRSSALLQAYRLSRESGELSLEEIRETLSVDVDASATFDEITYTAGTATVREEGLIGNLDVTLSLPSEGNTTVILTPGQILYGINSSAFAASPEIGISHSFSLRDDGDTLQDLRDAKSALNNEYLYRQNVSNLNISIYSKLVDILTYEKNILSAEQDITELRQTMENTLALGTYGEESSLYRGYQLQMTTLERSKASGEKYLALSKAQFAQIAGIDYQKLDTIEFPSLSFTPLSTGNSELILSELDVQIAREQLELLQRQSVASGSTWTVPSFSLNGDAKVSYVNTGTSTADYTLSAGAGYTGGAFSTTAQVGLDISSTGKLSPSVTIGGSWSSPSTASKSLQERVYANALSTAELTYVQDQLTYQNDSQKLSNDMLSWQSEVSEFNLTLEYHQSGLATAQEGFSIGLNTERDVREAEAELALDAYNQQILALEGLILEEQINQMKF